MFKNLIYGFVGIRAKSAEEGSVGVNRAKKAGYLLLTGGEAWKCQAYCMLFNCRVIGHGLSGLPFSYFDISQRFI